MNRETGFGLAIRSGLCYSSIRNEEFPKEREGNPMRRKSEELMERIQRFVEEFYLQHLRSPYTREIGEALGIAKSTAQKYLVEMNARGMLRPATVAGSIKTECNRKTSTEKCCCRKKDSNKIDKE